MKHVMGIGLLFMGVLPLSVGYSQTSAEQDTPTNEFVNKESLQHQLNVEVSSDGAVQATVCPLPLSLAIQTALENNPEVKAAINKIDASKGRFWSAVSPAAPEMSITHDYILAGTKVNNYGEKTVGISQPVDFPTNYFLRGSKYAIDKKIAEQEADLVKIEVISKVKKAYYTALALQEQVRIAQKNLSIAQDFTRKAEVRFSVGEGTNLERLTAKVNYTESTNNVEIEKNHLIAAFAELNFTLGYGKGEAKMYHLSDTLAFIPLNLTIDQLVDDAETANPQLQVNKLQVDSYIREKSLAWSSLLPNFNLSYFKKEVRDDANKYYGAAISIGVPLWFMLDNKGKIQEAAANVSVAQSELQTTGNSIYSKTKTAYSEFKHDEKQVQLYINDVLPQSEEIFRTASKSYEAGAITYLEYMQAQQTLINSRGAYVNALLSYNLSIVAIEEAIGKTLQ